MKRKRDEAVSDDLEDAARIENLSRACEEWELKWNSLSESYSLLRTDYDNLLLEHTEWETTISSYSVEIDMWKKKYSDLEASWLHWKEHNEWRD